MYLYMDFLSAINYWIESNSLYLINRLCQRCCAAALLQDSLPHSAVECCIVLYSVDPTFRVTPAHCLFTLVVFPIMLL